MKKIVVATDYSERSRESYVAAASLARRFWAKIVLIHEAEPPPSLYYEDVASTFPTAEFRASLERRLAEEAQAEAFADVEVEPLLLQAGGSIGSIVEYTQAERPDLVVVSTQGRSGLAHVLLGSFAENAVRRSASPVLVWRPGWPATDYLPSRVLVPFDFSQNSRAVLPQLHFLARAAGSRFTFLHVIRPADGPLPARTGAAAESTGGVADEVRARFEELSRQELDGLDAELVIVDGQPSERITKTAAEHGVDLVLMATRGWTGLKHLLVGSVAERVVRRAPCPVLVVRPTA